MFLKQEYPVWFVPWKGLEEGMNGLEVGFLPHAEI